MLGNKRKCAKLVRKSANESGKIIFSKILDMSVDNGSIERSVSGAGSGSVNSMIDYNNS
jgi:hypothetical protein